MKKFSCLREGKSVSSFYVIFITKKILFMLATLTSHRLLEIEDTSLDTGKLYQHDFQGYQISGKNRLLFVFHKKEIKLIELKNIGSTMGVFYFAERPPFCEIPLLPVFVELA